MSIISKVDEIKSLLQEALEEAQKQELKKVNAAGRRFRKVIRQVEKIAKESRIESQAMSKES